MNLAGGLTPLFSLTDNTRELNGIGISSMDQRGYALTFTRPANCTDLSPIAISLMRFGANGMNETLGVITAPMAGAVLTPLGAMDASGNYYFGATDITGKFYVGKISNVGAITGTGAIAATYTAMNIACPAVFADWAVNPKNNNQLYTYGIYNAGTPAAQIPTGTLVKIDLTTQTITCVGTQTTGTMFTDTSDDNFAGVMFGADGALYGMNVKDRRFYRIDTTTGGITYINTLAGGTGQLRGDMGSCAAGGTPPPTSFNCPGSYVIGYKNGTNCSKFPYNLYTMDYATGNINPTPFLSTPDTIDLNGIGISKKDNKGYGLTFRRDDNSTPGSCINDTIKFIRFGANGVIETLGYLRQTSTPPVIIPNSAVGAMDAQGNYYFISFANNIFPYVCKISATDTLTAQPNRQLTYTFQQVYGACVRTFADWAISPTTGQLVSYGISRRPSDNKVTGSVISINPATGFSSCTGIETENEFTDEGNDNMGGIMFGADGFLYGANSYTRKYYKINVTTGVISNINSVANLNNPNPSTPQIRVDMASCITDATTLPIGFNDLMVASGGDCKANLTWDVSGTEDGDAFTLERSADGIKYATVGSVRGAAGVSKYAIADTKPGITNYYRIKGVSRDGSVKYSSVVRYLSSCGSKNNALLFNTMVTNGTVVGEVSLYRTQTVAYTIYNAAGVQVFNKTSVNNAGTSRFSYNVPALSKGVYMMQILISGEKFMQKFVVQ
jgi:hypothetical protein